MVIAGIVAALTMVTLAPPAVSATAPRPVTNLALDSVDGLVYVTWSASPDTTSAQGCYLPGSTAPDSPTTPGAQCGSVTTSNGWSFAATEGQSYGVSVFSYDASTSTYGSPASGTVVGADLPPLPPVSLKTVGYSASSLSLTWADDTQNGDVVDYLISWSPGMTTPDPPSTMDDKHVTTGTNLYVSGLSGGTAYTFAVRSRDRGGHVSSPALVVASGRSPGVAFSQDKDGTISASLGWGGVPAPVAALSRTGATIETAFASGAVQVAPVTFTTNWSVSYLPSTPGARDAFVGIGTPGFKVVAWTATKGAYYAVRSTSGKWSGLQRPTTNAADRVVGAAADANNRVHLLILRTAGTGRGLWYVTNGSGKWTRAQIAGSGAGDIGLLALDLSTNKIVLVDRHRSSTDETIRVAVLPPTATKPSSVTTWLSTKNRSVQWRPTSLAATGGAITVALSRVSSPAASSDGPYLLAGTASSHRSAARVAGTTAADTSMRITSQSRNSLLLTWQRRNAAWDPSKLGIWVAPAKRSTVTAAWSVAASRHWTRSAYDVPVAAYRHPDGYLRVIYCTALGDVRE